MTNRNFFYQIDLYLPRRIAIFPYQVAKNFLQLVAKASFNKKAQVWSRNSVQSGSFVFGASDLDLTFLTTSYINHSFLKEILRVSKGLFPFLGEAHLYCQSDLAWILPFGNIYELKRDPVLWSKWQGSQLDLTVEKFVFLQRMFFSDFLSLHQDPERRQRKWHQHYTLLEFERPSVIEIKGIVHKLSGLVGDDPKIQEALARWMKGAISPGFNFYEEDLGEAFKLLAPHLYLWFRDRPQYDIHFLESLSDFQKKIILRQIDWEIWGIYCQRYWIDEKRSLTHLDRLFRVSEVLDKDRDNHQLRLKFESLLKPS